MINDSINITVVDAMEGQSISVVGGTYRVIISGKQTSGSYALIDMLIPSGSGPGPHAHPNMQESFYVIDGEIEFKTASGTSIAGKGSFVHIPLGGLIHSFTNRTETIAHLLCTVMPAGLEEFFQEIGKPVETGAFLPVPVLNVEEMANLKFLAEKYGQQLYPPDYWVNG